MKTKDNGTLIRQWTMLQMIPRYPIKITASQLHEKLSREYNVAKRTVERDLLSLEATFQISSDQDEKKEAFEKEKKRRGLPYLVAPKFTPYGWSWEKGGIFNLPGMSNSEALTFNLVEEHLRPILPASILDQLQPFFKAAEKKLSSLSENSQIHTWLDKVRVVHPTQALLAPVIDAEIHHVISEALLSDKQVRAVYQRPGQDTTIEYIINPLALIEQGKALYLICESSAVKHMMTLPLHRFKSVEMLNIPCTRPADFNLDKFIESGGMGFGGGGESINLEAIFTNFAGGHLYGTPLSQDQTITLLDDGRLKITATVVNTERLRWWLLNFGEGVEVIAPPQLREVMKNSANALHAMYNKS